MPRKYFVACVLLIRAAFFACIVLLVGLSWLPGSAMVRTGVGGHLEHTTAYFVTAIIMSLAYRERPQLRLQALFLAGLAAILELGQQYVLGGASAVLDFAASSTGVAIGGLLMWAARPRVLSYVRLDRISDAH